MADMDVMPNGVSVNYLETTGDGTVNNALSDGVVTDVDKILRISQDNTANITSLIQLMTQIVANTANTDRRVGELENRMHEREQSERLTSAHKKDITDRVHRRVYTLIGTRKKGGKIDPETKKRNKVYSNLFHSRLWGSLKGKFNVNVYDEIRDIDYEDAVDYINRWEPEDGIDALKAEAEENWEDNHPGMSVSTYLGRLF